MIPRQPTTCHYVVLFFSFFIASCQDEKGFKPFSKKTSIFSSSIIQIDQVNADLKQKIESRVLQANDSTHQLQHKWIRELYSLSNYQPYWIADGGVEQFVKQYVEQIDSLKFDGLNTTNYNGDSLLKVAQLIDDKKITSINDISNFEIKMSESFMQMAHDIVIGQQYEVLRNKDWKNKNDTAFNGASFLKEIITKNSIQLALQQLRPQHSWYNKFREEYKKLHQRSIDGGWATINQLEDSLDMGFQSKQIPALRTRMFKEIGEPLDTISDTWNTELVTSIKKYQFQNQIKQTGIVDSATLKVLNKGIDEKLKTLALNMERLRWLKKDFPQPFIWVDVPKMELDYVENDSVKFNMRVVVGRKGRPTPSLDSKIENIVLSPPWTVPPTIMKEEVVPGIARKGGSYLARRGLKAYRGGRLVNPAMINAKNFKQFAISQAPGYRSSLGEVKFNMLNPWAIYLHDTPHREDFVKSFRAYSSGCIRVHKPKQFAEFLLNDTNKYSYKKIDSICKKRTTIYIPFNRQVNVHIVYLTNALDSLGNVMYLKDVYGWDKL